MSLDISPRCVGQSPVDPSRSRLSSRYGVRGGRTTGKPTFHAGLDFTGKVGDPVRAVTHAQVARVVRDTPATRGFSGYGNAVVLYLIPLRLFAFYAHLSDVRVVPGQMLGAGQLIGYVGNTTNGKFKGMGPHLHFEVRRPKADGYMPFPAPYRQYNVDPLPVLTSIGVQFTPAGAIREQCVTEPRVT